MKKWIIIFLLIAPRYIYAKDFNQARLSFDIGYGSAETENLDEDNNSTLSVGLQALLLKTVYSEKEGLGFTFGGGVYARSFGYDDAGIESYTSKGFLITAGPCFNIRDSLQLEFRPFYEFGEGSFDSDEDIEDDTYKAFGLTSGMYIFVGSGIGGMELTYRDYKGKGKKEDEKFELDGDEISVGFSIGLRF